jgi:ketosteroid isomerase-like protein
LPGGFDRKQDLKRKQEKSMTITAVRALAWCMHVAMFSVFGAAAAVATSAPSTMEDNNKRVITEAFSRWAAGGTSFFNDVLDENVVWRIEGSAPSAGEFRGREIFLERAVRPFAARLSTPVRPTAVRVWADGDHVIAHWQGAGEARDGRRYSNSYAWIFRMHNGKAAEVTAFLDLAPYDDVLRRIPAPSQQEVGR